MKKQLPFIALLWLLTACKSIPDIFSVNNFSMTDSAGRAAAGISQMVVPDITGNWAGMEHKIRIEENNSLLNELPTYKFGLIDTKHSEDSGSTWYTLNFMKAGNNGYSEAIRDGVHRDEHDFALVLSTYVRLNKLTADTIITQVMNSAFTESWLKKRGYKYFITAEEELKKEHTIYLTESLPRLAALLKEIYRMPHAFKEADTLVRVRQGF